MAVPREVVEIIRHWCENQGPEELRDEVGLEMHVAGNKVTIYERSLMGTDSLRVPSAQLRLDPSTRVWSLYWQDSHDRWHIVQATPSLDIRDLLAEIEADPDCLFFG